MGKLKDRLTTTITADLVGWRRHSQLMVEGIVDRSIDPEFIDGCNIYITFAEVIHYPELTGHWGEHYICKNFEGLYFRLEVRSERRG